uniref:NADH-ubiquinone oxidoreductase chain 5 n=1 Tax=Uromastyx benti TaxID=236742 RepID=D6RR69_9SAUR|nr:NADH dehydrogenase subunit 5 [Uromastyx benti]BAJ08057.1 NADH dehydrogenase subunit 5 [Uromastyx benti]
MAILPMTTTILATIVLLIPMLPIKNEHLALSAKSSVKMAFLISLVYPTISMKNTPQSMTIHPTLMDIGTFSITTSITINQHSTMFLPVATLVTWSIMEFSTWYMNSDPNLKKFTNYLTTFLISMIILTTAGSMLQLFIGWEGVGVMSFLLINWWYSRMNANSAALQAIIYNRIGDIGMIMAISSMATSQSSWDIEQILVTQTNNQLLTTGLILAAMGKSAQFFMHMWLPAAMEGPTPVSALLHSSTMVIAGVYLLSYLHPLLLPQKYMLPACLYLGATTSLYAALCALTQNDIKKIIAFSTSSQLGLMMTAIGLNLPKLALLHIITHAVFKSMLFLTAGSIIHNLQNEQDIRKMGNLNTQMPITSSCLTIGSLALIGTPFLSGFYSKDPILETMLSSHINAWALLTTIAATTMTSSYTTRMILHTMTATPRQQTTTNIHEAQKNLTMPILRLAMATVFLGAVMTTALQTETTPNTMPTSTKLAPTMAMLLGAYFAMEVANSNTSLKLQNKNTTYNFLNQLAFYNTTHRSIPKTTLKFSQTVATQLTDLFWLEKVGPKLTSTINTKLSKTVSAQNGLIKNYLTTTLLTTLLALLYLSTLPLTAP